MNYANFTQIYLPPISPIFTDHHVYKLVKIRAIRGSIIPALAINYGFLTGS